MSRGSADLHEVQASLVNVPINAAYLLMAVGALVETLVSYRGSRLSAGEKQLISIARAFVANPPVLILDEATSSLAPSTEEMVEVALRGLLKGRTSVVIAHRLSTAEHADRVLVVDHGHIVEDGSHADLVRRNGYYSALYRQWTSGREPGRTEIVA